MHHNATPNGQLHGGFIISATTSGVGKTTISSALMRAFANMGLETQGAKVGPDYIDPQYHLLATGKPSYNLDPFIGGGPIGVKRTLSRLAASDVVVVEGVMGLYDGTYLTPTTGPIDHEIHKINYASTAHVATITKLPVVLLVDATATSMSLSATIEGFISHSDLVEVKGVVVNKVGSKNHSMIIERALSQLPIEVLGLIPRDRDLALPSRHLGLVQPLESEAQSNEMIERSSEIVSKYIDIRALLSISRPLRSHAGKVAPSNLRLLRYARAPLVAVARGSAFEFTYHENLDILREHGAQIRFFDPLEEEFDQASTHLFLGGGYPELHMSKIAKNKALLRQIKEFASDGGRIWAECGGHMLLGKAIEHVDAVGVLPHTSHMSKSLHLGYRKVVAKRPNPLFDMEDIVPAHEYHYSTTIDDASDLTFEGFNHRGSGGVSTDTIISSYMHFHLGGLIK